MSLKFLQNFLESKVRQQKYKDTLKKKKLHPSIKKNVCIVNIEKVGNYAIRIIFDDGHDTGIYSWSYLRKVSENNIILYKEYLERVAKIKSV